MRGKIGETVGWICMGPWPVAGPGWRKVVATNGNLETGLVLHSVLFELSELPHLIGGWQEEQWLMLTTGPTEVWAASTRERAD